MNMAQAKKELMDIANGEYHNIEYKVTDDGHGGVSQECCVYINGMGSAKAAHWDLALAELRDVADGKPPLSEDLPVSAKS